MTPQPYSRRSTDGAKTLDIEAMIAAEDDAKQRAFLIVLNSINTSLMANTSTVRDVANKLDAHLTAYEDHVTEETAILNKGRGMWTVGAWVLGIAQLAVLGGGARLINDIDHIHQAIQAAQRFEARTEQRLSALEIKK